MFMRGSRYRSARAFANEEGRIEEFDGVRPRDIGPAEGVIEHVPVAGDRPDALAHRFYKDGRKWWRVLDANPNVLYAGDLHRPDSEGVVILIPRASEPS
jgi:hypothetical protein